ncbi:DUF2306 domain-containing protein [uncultured Sphingomonas sp.]|uniref:DUF2306 domain-containing protein n=1 Tax=uncultured Sphingomonas sp. TaxID=158754 RepID=UPI0035CB437D
MAGTAAADVDDTQLTTPGVRPRPIGSDAYERVLAWASLTLFAVALVAIGRGRPEWNRIPALIWLHLATVLFATGLTPVILLGRRGDRRHHKLGRVWSVAMIGTAAMTLGIRVVHPGHWSWIHLLSIWVLLFVPRLWWTAAHHRVEAHRRAVRGVVTGAILIAGFFTFPFGRLMGRWLFG